MRVNKVLSSVMTKPWLIDEQSAEGYLPLVLKMLDQPAIAQAPAATSSIKKEKPKPKPYAVAIIGAGGAATSAMAISMAKYSSYDQAPAGSIAVINLDGPMMQDDFCGTPGTRTLGQRILEADAHPNIAGHVLKSNSPGGTVAGTEHFANIIASTKKPFVSFVENMHSAAYWSGSSSDLIVMGGQTAGAGSIGTMTTIADYTKYYERMGIAIRNVRATKSVDKNESYYQAQQGNPEKLQQEVLDPLNEVFLSAVKANRGDKLNLKKEDVLTGKVYHGNKAIEVGLADEIGSFEYAVQRAHELAGEASDSNQSSNNNQDTMSLFGKNKFPKLAALAGKPAAEITDAEIDAVNDELEANGIEHAGMISSTQLTTFEAAIQEAKDLKAANAQLTADLATANAEVTRLGALDGAKSTNTPKSGNEMQEEEGTDENQAIIDNLPHNRALAGNPAFN